MQTRTLASTRTQRKARTAWVAQELGQAHLGDPRRTQRLVGLVSVLAAHPGASIPDACGSWAATKGAYRFLDNAAVTPDAILAAHTASTRARMAAEPMVLLVQDTTSLDFTSQRHTTGLGPIGRQADGPQGLEVHTTLALDAAGIPLGLAAQQVWARDPSAHGQKHARKQRPIADKESQKWLTGLLASTADLPAGPRALMVGDREADVYDLFLLPRPVGVDLLVRGSWDRAVLPPAEDEAPIPPADAAAAATPADAAPAVAVAAAYLWATAAAWRVQARRPFAVPRKEQQPERTATLSLRFGTVQLRPPRARRAESLPSVRVSVVLVQEEEPTEGVTPLRWLLLTTLPVEEATGAWQVVTWYSSRWRIEQYHYVLKSGCQIEQLQLDTAERLERALALYAVIAWRLLWLLYTARRTPAASAAPALSRAEWQTLWCVQHEQPTPPPEPPTLREAVRWIAQLGGFLGRTRDGEPGVKTLWRGWQRLTDMTTTFVLLHPSAILETSG